MSMGKLVGKSIFIAPNEIDKTVRDISYADLISIIDDGYDSFDEAVMDAQISKGSMIFELKIVAVYRDEGFAKIQ